MTAIILSALFKSPQKDEEDDDDEEEAFAGSAGLYHCEWSTTDLFHDTTVYVYERAPLRFTCKYVYSSVGSCCLEQ